MAKDPNRIAEMFRKLGYLRRKLGRERFQTVRGMGYLIAAGS